jgi:Putative Ig domain
MGRHQFLIKQRDGPARRAGFVADDAYFVFPIGTRVKLFASEEDCSTFVRWSSPCDGTLFIGVCTFDMTRSGGVGASFRNGNQEAIAVNAPLPAGLTLDAVTGVITGTPTQAISPTLRFRSSGGREFDESNNILLELRP